MFWKTKRRVLIDAARHGDLATVQRLTQQKKRITGGLVVNVNKAKDPYSGRTALHYASYFGELAVVQYLIQQAGAQVECQGDQGGETALHIASQMGCLAVVQYLVQEAGANVNARDKFGRTPLFAAVHWGQERVIEFLTEHGAHAEAKDVDGETALHIASEHDWQRNAVICLVETTTSAAASRRGHRPADNDLLHLLLDAKDQNDDTALVRAAINGQLNVTRYLVEQTLVVCRNTT